MNDYAILDRYADEHGIRAAEGCFTVCAMTGEGDVYDFTFPFAAGIGEIGERIGKTVPEGSVFRAMICFLTPRVLDLPSRNFRIALADLDRRNLHAGTYLRGNDGIVRTELGATLAAADQDRFGLCRQSLPIPPAGGSSVSCRADPPR